MPWITVPRWSSDGWAPVYRCAVLPDAVRTVPVAGRLDLRRTLAPARRGPGDPTMVLGHTGCWRATNTPEGPATTSLRHVGSRLEVEAWGAGARWAVEHAPALAGLDDDPDGFDPSSHPVVATLHRRLPGLRIGRTAAVCEALLPSVLEQKVTGLEARRSYRTLVRRLGRPAPGPAGLVLPPTPAVLAATPSWTFHRAGVERKRADTIVRAMARAVRLEEATSLPRDDARRRLQAFPGVGPWTAAEVAGVALGDCDAVSVGDHHLKNQVSWVLAGEARGSDDRMLELLEPWRGHRNRVVRLIVAAGLTAPRFGPRHAVRSIASI
jgi:3-methyladenine DNA glycosylase/8-oxoguanine DNA glycosylase